MLKSLYIFLGISVLGISAMFFVGANIASAHEVYVLTPQEVSQAITMTSPNPFTAIPEDELEFLGWGVLVVVILLIVLSASVSRTLERKFDPFLVRLKKYAPIIARVTFGLSLILAGYFGDFFGPELPVSGAVSSGVAHILGFLVIFAGILMILGFLTRVIALFVMVMFAFTVYKYNFYMLTYVNYLGEAVLLFILGGGKWSFDRAVPALIKIEDMFKGIGASLEKYSFFILRVLFGFGFFFASFYAKFLHSNLALNTVTDYHLTNYFHFTPLFLVLGAFILEALIGMCYMIGFEIRFIAIFMIAFMTLSLVFFGETVWPHLILFGVGASLFAHGYDKYTLEKAVFQRSRKGEPVL